MRWVTREHPHTDRIARGFQYLGMPDQEQLRLELPVYDALSAWAQHQIATSS